MDNCEFHLIGIRWQAHTHHSISAPISSSALHNYQHLPITELASCRPTGWRVKLERRRSYIQLEHLVFFRYSWPSLSTLWLAAISQGCSAKTVYAHCLFFPFNCFISRSTYQHTQSHMLTHILCIHRGMYLIHRHFIQLCQIHLIPSLRTDFKYEQLHENNIKKCSLERQKVEKSELRAQTQITDSNYCPGTANSATSCLSTTRNLLLIPRNSPQEPTSCWEPNVINTQLKHRKQMVWQSCKTGYSVSWCQENDTALSASGLSVTQSGHRWLSINLRTVLKVHCQATTEHNINTLTDPQGLVRFRNSFQGIKLAFKMLYIFLMWVFPFWSSCRF